MNRADKIRGIHTGSLVNAEIKSNNPPELYEVEESYMPQTSNHFRMRIPEHQRKSNQRSSLSNPKVVYLHTFLHEEEIFIALIFANLHISIFPLNSHPSEHKTISLYNKRDVSTNKTVHCHCKKSRLTVSDTFNFIYSVDLVTGEYRKHEERENLVITEEVSRLIPVITEKISCLLTLDRPMSFVAGTIFEQIFICDFFSHAPLENRISFEEKVNPVDLLVDLGNEKFVIAKYNDSRIFEFNLIDNSKREIEIRKPVVDVRYSQMMVTFLLIGEVWVYQVAENGIEDVPRIYEIGREIGNRHIFFSLDKEEYLVTAYNKKVLIFDLNTAEKKEKTISKELCGRIEVFNENKVVIGSTKGKFTIFQLPFDYNEDEDIPTLKSSTEILRTLPEVLSFSIIEDKLIATSSIGEIESLAIQFN